MYARVATLFDAPVCLPPKFFSLSHCCWSLDSAVVASLRLSISTDIRAHSLAGVWAAQAVAVTFLPLQPTISILSHPSHELQLESQQSAGRRGSVSVNKRQAEKRGQTRASL